jgi:hypothetical protein
MIKLLEYRELNKFYNNSYIFEYSAFSFRDMNFITGCCQKKSLHSNPRKEHESAWSSIPEYFPSSNSLRFIGAKDVLLAQGKLTVRFE